MDTLYGLRAELQGYLWKDTAEEFEKNGIRIKIANGSMEVGYDKEADTEKAKRMALLLINAHNLRNGKRIIANFNHTWKPGTTGNVQHGISLSDTVHVSERIQVQLQTHEVTIGGIAHIVNKEVYDSAKFSNDSSMVDRALADDVLAKALGYFSEEVVDNARPLYGAYEAIEVITKHLGKEGRKTLGILAGETDVYVSELMETTQLERHAVTDARRLLDDGECKERAKILIEAYSKSVKIT